ncbi:MAG: hypothetical protein JNN26_00395 [Candidatus Obscuribacter sp.]|nr:hypothetical protein [Candidatus Obscuribacter sp.]
MFPFDATTLACLAPALVLWSLAYFMYRWQSRSLRLRASAPSREPAEGKFLGRFAKPKPLRPAQLAQLIIYGFCLILASSLLSLFVTLDFLRPAVPSETSVILTIFAYQLISIGLVLPVLYILMAALNRRIVPEIAPLWSRLQPISQSILFCVIAIVALPLLESLKTSIGISHIPHWVARDVFRVSLAISPVPSAILFMFVTAVLSKENSIYGVDANEVSLYRDYLEDRNFHLWLLDDKSDEEINRIIAVARSIGDLAKADVLSRILLDRHLLDRSN